jgi:hypothetical protein
MPTAVMNCMRLPVFAHGSVTEISNLKRPPVSACDGPSLQERSWRVRVWKSRCRDIDGPRHKVAVIPLLRLEVRPLRSQSLLLGPARFDVVLPPMLRNVTYANSIEKTERHEYFSVFDELHVDPRTGAAVHGEF